MRLVNARAAAQAIAGAAWAYAAAVVVPAWSIARRGTGLKAVAAHADVLGVVFELAHGLRVAEEVDDRAERAVVLVAVRAVLLGDRSGAAASTIGSSKSGARGRVMGRSVMVAVRVVVGYGGETRGACGSSYIW